MSMISVLNLFASRLVSFERCANFTQFFYIIILYTYKFIIYLFSIKSERAYTTTNLEVDNFSLKWPERGDIIFKNLSLRYRPTLPQVLKNLSFSI